MSKVLATRMRLGFVLASVLAILAIGMGPASAGSRISMKLTHTQGTLVTGTAVTFDGSKSRSPKSDRIASWRYTFGDGSRAESGKGKVLSVRHTFTRTGTFRVTLRVTTARGNTGGMSTQVRIRTAPTPSGPGAPPPATSVSRSVPPAGGTVTTIAEATPADPVGTSVTVPPGAGGTVTITEAAPVLPPPSGFTFVGQAVQIEAPPAMSNSSPLVLRFVLDASVLGSGTPQVLRNGIPVENCSADALAAPEPVADPDPCVEPSQALPGGDLQLTVRTTHASLWNFAVPVTPGKITGRVTDTNGNGLNQISVSAVTDGGGDSASATTASDGSYTLENLFPGTAVVCAEFFGFGNPGGDFAGVGYLPTCVNNVPVVANGTTPNVILQLPAAAAVAGTITDAQSGTPIEGAFAVVVGLGPGIFERGSDPSDADGDYVVRGVEPGTYQLCFQASGYVRQCRTTNVTLTSPNVLQPIDFALVPQVSSTAAVLGAGGDLATNTTVTQPDPVGTKVTTPVAGGVSITESPINPFFPPAPHGFKYVGQSVLIGAPAATASGPLVVDFFLDESVLEAKTPVAVHDGQPLAPCTSLPSAVPDPCVELTEAVGNDAHLVVRSSSGAGEWRFAIDNPAGIVTGRFVDENGNGLQAVFVEGTGEGDGLSFQNTTDATGAFEALNVTPGEYNVCGFSEFNAPVVGGDFDDAGYLPACTGTSFVVTDDDTVDVGNIVMVAGAAVSATVTDSVSTDPIAGVVSLYAISPNASRSVDFAADHVAPYVLQSMQPGLYRVCVAVESYQTECQNNVPLTKGAVTPVNFALDPA